MEQTIGAFNIKVSADGVALVVFSRPPVNAVSISVYEDIGRLVDALSADSAVRVIVLTAPEGARAWCGSRNRHDLAGLCDLRIAAEDAVFACPEIDYGLVAGGAGLFSWLKLPEAKVREVLYTGRKFSARELEPTGFFNYVVPRGEVLGRAMDLARVIAVKSLPAIRARKRASAALEKLSWMEAYLDAQQLSAELVATEDAGEGVRAFLEHRPAHFKDG